MATPIADSQAIENEALATRRLINDARIKIRDAAQLAVGATEVRASQNLHRA